MVVEAKQSHIERLRQQIQRLQAAPRRYLATLRSGISSFDELIPGGGIPLGQVLELWGEAASGRTSLTLRTLASATAAHRLAAYVDGPGELYPLAAAALGVDLSRLLIVRPKAPGKLVWSAVQLARSGAFAGVALDLTHTAVRLSLAESKKLADAAAKGGCALLVLSPPDVPAGGMIRFRVIADDVRGIEVELQRHRQAPSGARSLVSWEELYPGEAPRFRYGGLDSASAEGAVPADERPFRRPKLCWPRDGVGIAQSRPGRDHALPELASSLAL